MPKGVGGAPCMCWGCSRMCHPPRGVPSALPASLCVCLQVRRGLYTSPGTGVTPCPPSVSPVLPTLRCQPLSLLRQGWVSRAGTPPGAGGPSAPHGPGSREGGGGEGRVGWDQSQSGDTAPFPPPGLTPSPATGGSCGWTWSCGTWPSTSAPAGRAGSRTRIAVTSTAPRYRAPAARTPSPAPPGAGYPAPRHPRSPGRAARAPRPSLRAELYPLPGDPSASLSCSRAAVRGLLCKSSLPTASRAV